MTLAASGDRQKGVFQKFKTLKDKYFFKNAPGLWFTLGRKTKAGSGIAANQHCNPFIILHK